MSIQPPAHRRNSGRQIAQKVADVRSRGSSEPDRGSADRGDGTRDAETDQRANERFERVREQHAEENRCENRRAFVQHDHHGTRGDQRKRSVPDAKMVRSRFGPDRLLSHTATPSIRVP